MAEKTKGVQKLWERYKFVMLIVMIGVVLLLWPNGSRIAEQTGQKTASSPTSGSEQMQDLQEAMEEILSKISGVGQVQVLLTLDSDGERQLAQNTQLSYRGDTAAPEDYSRNSETVLAENGSGEESIITRQIYPTYRGALVVCQGGDQAEVQLAVIHAVSSLTGLSSDRIAVAKWQSSFGGGNRK